MSGRVRVIPGSSLPPSHTIPKPPATPPPKPSHLCKIAIVGDAYCGKSSLVQKFIHRRYANSSNSGDNVEGETCDGDTANTNGATSFGNSLGTSLGATSYEAMEPTLADYYKKDVTIYDDHQIIIDNNIKPQSQDEQRKSVCIRVQCWDMNLHQHFIKQQQTESDLNSCGHSIQSASSVMSPSPRYNNMVNIAPLLPLLKRANGIMIVCRCPLPPINFSHSSNASYVSYASNATCSDWPELDALEQQIQKWATFLHQEEENQDKKQRQLLFVMLSCADLAVTGYSPRHWMALSVRMQDICKSNHIDSWKIGTCINTNSSDDNIDGEYSKQQSKLLQRMMIQQKQILEDMEDSIEAAFVDIISMHIREQKAV